MDKIDNFQSSDISDFQKLENVRAELNKKFQLVLDETGKPKKLNVKTSTLLSLQNILKIVSDAVTKEKSRELVDFIKDLFKALRNCMAVSKNNQNLFVKNDDALVSVKTILHSLIKDLKQEDWSACIKIIYQFLINLIVGNETSALKVWETFSNMYKEMCEESDPYYAMALLYNILTKHQKLNLSDDIYTIVLNLFDEGKENEYVVFLLELFLKQDHFCQRYGKLKLRHRIILLEILKQKMVIDNNKQFGISRQQLMVLSTEFKQKSDCILKTVPDYLQNIDAQEVALLLEILASLSSREKYLLCLQRDKSLIINCAYLLKSIHEAGKQGDSNFSPVQSLSEVNKVGDGKLRNPAFGFKADLIRLLGNLCWKHKENQDSMREMDCIPLILDCCNIDARNPFIIQWAILAVRNLLEKNEENQKIVASMTQKGLVDSKVLQELGITLHGDGDTTLQMVSLEALKSQTK